MSVAYDSAPYVYDDAWLNYDSDDPAVTVDPRYTVARTAPDVTVLSVARNYSVSVVQTLS